MKIIVHAEECDRPAGPVAVQLPLERLDPQEMIGLVDCELDKPLPIQTDTRGRMVWWCRALSAGQSRTYKLNSAGLLQDVGRVVVNEMGREYASIFLRGREFARYHYFSEMTRPRLNLALVHGEADDFPVELRCGWAKTNGLNFWGNDPPIGIQKHRRFSICASGPVLGRLGMVIDWVTADHQIYLTEHRSFVAYNSPAEYEIVDVLIRLRMVSEKVVFQDTAEGGICSIQVNSNTFQNSQLCNSESGQGEKECWGQTANWCHYSGQYVQRPAGITILDSPENMRHPTYWNGSINGLVAANPFGLGSFLKNNTISGSREWKRDENTMFRYRVLIHHQSCDPKVIDQHYQSYTLPVRIEIH